MAGEVLDSIPRPPAGSSFAYAVYRIASSFVSLDDIDTIFNTALTSLGQVCGAGRAYVFLFDDARAVMNNTHEWCAAGVEPQIEMLQSLPLEMFPWWMEKLKNGEMILVPDVSLMGPEAQAERAILEEQDIKSVLVLPIYNGSLPAGFIGIDDVTTTGTWEPETREYLRVAADMVSSTMTREEQRQVLVRRTHELEKAYENLKQTQVRLLEAEKLAGVGILAAGIAHEINNPASFIVSNTETMRRYIDELDRIIASIRSARSRDEIAAILSKPNVEYLLSDTRDILDGNASGLDRITRIVQNLMSFSRIEQPEAYDSIDINDSLDIALTLAGRALLDTAEVSFERGDTPKTLCNQNELNHAFYNVIMNAIQSVREYRSREKGLIGIRTWEEAGTVCCEISDNGAGFTEDALKRAFEPFFTTRQVGKGTGLGMSIVYDTIVTKHGGAIEVANLDSGGALVTIRIPVKTR